MNAEQRLKLAARCAALVRAQIDLNGGRYSGGFTPNLQSIMDLATVDDRMLGEDVENRLAELERKFGLA